MDNKIKIEEEIERTLQSIEGIERLESSPYMFQKVKARIDEQAKEKLPVFRVKYVLAIIMIVLMNVLTLALFYKDMNAAKKNVKNENIQLISKEYSINPVNDIIY